MLATRFTESSSEHFSSGSLGLKVFSYLCVFWIYKMLAANVLPNTKVADVAKEISHAETQHGNMHDIIVAGRREMCFDCKTLTHIFLEMEPIQNC